MKLEAEIEVQRKIVTAALKLANDVNSNKVIRKKRRRDYENAQSKLRELDKQLNHLRISSSKPDISDSECTSFRIVAEKLYIISYSHKLSQQYRAACV